MAEEQVTPDTPAAVSFLKRIYPEGPWCLTAIETDRKDISTRTFGPSTEAELAAWLGLHNGRRNLYFSVNPVSHVLEKKADKEDIAAMCFLHVDIDPRAGEDVGQEQERALRLLTDKLPKGIPPPTLVIFSGGGYQGFWELAAPLQLDGLREKYEEAERYNKQLEIVFGGDHCWNIDRIMRLPGTINLPDAKKIKKGRRPALACLVCDTGVRHMLTAFTPAPKVQSKIHDTGGSGVKVEVGGNIPRVASVDELDAWEVPDRVKVILVQGHDPDNPKAKDNSRSAWLFDAVCQLVRKAVPDEVIYSLITDPDYRISESVLASKNVEKYALRQIEKAKEWTIEPWLAKLNEQYSVVMNFGGKCRVIQEVLDPVIGRARLTKQTKDDFCNSYCNKFVTVGTDAKGLDIRKPVGSWWFGHEQRRQYSHITFAPGGEVPGAYNLWQGFAVPAVPGDCDKFLTHIRENICSGVDEHYDYLIRWMARAVQTPATPGYTAVVMRGGRGTGKSFFAKAFGSLFGRHFLQVSNSQHLVGNFNSHLRDCVVLFGDEAFYAGDKRHESVLKTLITEEMIAIESKGVDIEAQPNYTHLLLASNEHWVVPAGAAERRFFVLEVADKHIQDGAYFQAIADQLKNGGQQALLHHLLTLDLTGWDVRTVPKTEALDRQKAFSMGVEDAWWHVKLVDGEVRDGDGEWKTLVACDQLQDDYINHCRKLNITKRANSTALGILMKQLMPVGFPRKSQRRAKVNVESMDGFQRTVTKRLWFYELPTLQECRDSWTKVHGGQPIVDGVQGELIDLTDSPIPF